MVLKVGVQQLVDDMPAVDRQAFAHMVAGVLAGDEPAQLNQPQQVFAVPGIQVVLLRFQLRQFLRRIVDQGGQLCPVGGGHRLAQHHVDLFADNARRAVEDVDERLVLAVQVAHKMFGALGQAGQGFQVDDLAGSRGDGGVLFGQHAQIAQLFRGGGQSLGHGSPPFRGRVSAAVTPAAGWCAGTGRRPPADGDPGAPPAWRRCCRAAPGGNRAAAFSAVLPAGGPPRASSRRRSSG